MGGCTHSRDFTLETKGPVQIRCTAHRNPLFAGPLGRPNSLRPTQIKPVPAKIPLNCVNSFTPFCGPGAHGPTAPRLRHVGTIRS